MLLGGCLVGLFVVFVIFAYQIYFSDKVYPNVYFAGEKVGGLTKAELASRVEARINKVRSEEIVFNLDDKEIKANLGEMGVDFDPKATIDEIYAVGRTPKNAFGSLTLVIHPVNVKADYFVNVDKLTTLTNRLFTPYEKQPQNADIEFVGGSFVLVKEEAGRLVDRSLLYGELAKDLDTLDFSPINVALVDKTPDIKQMQLEKAYENVRTIAKVQITLSHDYDKWGLGGKTLLDLLRIYPYNQNADNVAQISLGNGDITIKRIYAGDFVESDLGVNLDQVKIDTYLAGIAKVIDKPTKDAALRFEGGKVVEFSSAQDGQILDRDKVKKLILDRLSINNTNDVQKVAIELPVRVTKAKIDNAEVNSLGIHELIGSGVSYFSGSIPNRVFNISLGSSLINGVLVKPGDIFSFTNLVGAVSKEQGFKQAYVINAGRTVLDDGGGICQVSTTVFRAALNAGVPIVKRTAHAYRVSYYEQHGFKPGMDATIFSPNVDFQFKNDTSHHVLVQTTVDKVNSRLQVDIYGTGDGRKVEISDPVVSNITPAPEPKYQDDPTLPRGTTKQVDFAAAGATAVFGRKVYKGGQLVIDEKFKSNFRPWQAVFLVGTAG